MIIKFGFYDMCLARQISNCFLFSYFPHIHLMIVLGSLTVIDELTVACYSLALIYFIFCLFVFNLLFFKCWLKWALSACTLHLNGHADCLRSSIGIYLRLACFFENFSNLTNLLQLLLSINAFFTIGFIIEYPCWLTLKFLQWYTLLIYINLINKKI